MHPLRIISIGLAVVFAGCGSSTTVKPECTPSATVECVRQNATPQEEGEAQARLARKSTERKEAQEAYETRERHEHEAASRAEQEVVERNKREAEHARLELETMCKKATGTEAPAPGSECAKQQEAEKHEQEQKAKCKSEQEQERREGYIPAISDACPGPTPEY